MTATTSPTILVAGKTVGRLGYGLMGLSAWGLRINPVPFPQEDAFAAMKAFFDKYPQYISKIVPIVKGGVDVKSQSPAKGDDIEFFRNEIEQVKAILGDKELDVYSLARLGHTAVETIFTNMAQLIKEGAVKAIGVSEMSSASLEKAHKICPIAINEIGVSLSHTNPRFATLSPVPEDIPAGDFRTMLPRFQGQAFCDNQKLVDQVEEIAKKKGVTAGQLSLAWILAQSEFAIPIPGSSKVDRVRENSSAIDVKLNNEELEALNKLASAFEIQGARYPEMFQKDLMK
ncbi:pyridoxal reductase [Cryptococcus neoformans var. grubii Br795]|nr:pyridoxal reductase [Cryptococcus neoformans var. grubii Br795]